MKLIDKDKSKQKRGCVITAMIFCIISIILLIVVIFVPTDEERAQKTQEKQQEQASDDSITIREKSIAIAEDAIKNELKCPSTATFNIDECHVIYFSGHNKGDTIRVIANFDAQNEFGSYLRDTRYVDIKLTGNFNDLGNYQIIRVLSSKEAEKIDEKECEQAAKHSNLKYAGEK